MRKSRFALVVTALTASAAFNVSTASALDATNFQVRTTADLVALCGADPASSEYVAAIHFCHGFAAGAYQYYAAVEAATPTAKFVCAPTPPPTRNQVVAGYVIWARAHPDVMGSAAVDSIFRYLGTTYPCSE